MMKAMISQPMKGKTREEILTERKETAEVLEAAGYQVIDSVFMEYAKTHTPLQCLAKSIETLARADLVVFLTGWDGSRGCRIEHTCCSDYGIPVVYGIENFKARAEKAQ